MLWGNYSVLEKTAGRWFSGGATGQGLSRSSFGKNGPARSMFQAVDQKSAFPSGYMGGDALIIAQQSGGMGASNTIYGEGDLSFANLAGGLNAVAPLEGIGTISNAALALVLSAVAALSGSGAVSAAVAGRLDAAASLLGEGDVSAALGALAGASALLEGEGTVASTSSLKGNGNIAAEIVVTGDVLNSANVASAVWGALAASNDVAGTMGALLNASGAGGDPWAVTLEGTYTAADLVRIMASVLAGKVSGMETGTPTFRSVDDAADRVTAVTTTDGNRTAVTATGA